MKVRVQKIIAAAGVTSRRKAEELIAVGRVTVNGVTAVAGTLADSSCDEIRIDGEKLPDHGNFRYLMLNKPRGYVTTVNDERGRKTVLDLIDIDERIYPVGRLDMYSEGLLLLTNDGDLANRLLHPSGLIDKVYEVKVSGLTPEALEGMKAPMVIDGYQIMPAGVRVLREGRETALLEITIHEGRNRQIRKMAEACGLKVLRLKRVREGALSLGTLPAGSWRYLTDAEVTALKKT